MFCFINLYSQFLSFYFSLWSYSICFREHSSIMTGQRNTWSEMEKGFAMLSLEDEEQGGLMYEGDTEDLSEIDTRWCLVGRFLTESPIDFQAMQHKMASLWRPGRGMYVKQLDSNRFIFQFYHEVYIKRFIEGGLWTFGRFNSFLKG